MAIYRTRDGMEIQIAERANELGRWIWCVGQGGRSQASSGISRADAERQAWAVVADYRRHYPPIPTKAPTRGVHA